ncbi:MAG: ABC transporter ATP-binding protein, partial [Clostridiales bacterium]|nr:ABC transporter ATP-binding protein [Candidatus Apopatocola equi]
MCWTPTPTEGRKQTVPKTILEVENLATSFKTERGTLKAVDGVSFHVDKGEILGLVGESGCGKSVTSQSIMRLYDEKYLASYEGSVRFEGKELLSLSEKEMQRIRGKDIAMVFQDALSSLTPVFTVGAQIVEALQIHQGMKKDAAKERAVEMLRLVGIPSPEQRFSAYPHELSGGMRQRVMIAIALCCQPKLLIADEPTTALDVSIQAQIMDLIVELNRLLNMG